MERIRVNPRRIAWCCADRGVTPGQLAQDVGISENTVQRVVDGDGDLTIAQLRKIADYFNRGVLFFLEEEDVAPEQVHSPQFRTLSNQAPDLGPRMKALIERVEWQRDVFLSLIEDLGGEDRGSFEPPRFDRNSLEGNAAIAREWLGLSQRNTFSTYRRAIEDKGILVFLSNGYNGDWQIAKATDISGFSIFSPKCPVIVVKKERFESKQAFTLMHELGHILLHRESFVDPRHNFEAAEGAERAANDFAGKILVPDSFLREIPVHGRPLDVSQFEEWLRVFRGLWGVSTEVILRRLMDSRMIDAEEYQAYRAWVADLVIDEEGGGTRVYRHREPKHIFGETFVRAVVDAFNSRQITLAKATTYLDNIKVRDFHLLERHLAGA